MRGIAAAAIAAVLAAGLAGCHRPPALVRAVEAGDHARVRELAARDDMEHRGRALRLAVERGDVESTRILASSGDFDKQPAARAAARSGREELLRLIVDGGAEPALAVLNDAVGEGHRACAAYLIERGAAPDGSTTAAAAKSGDAEMLSFVLKNGGPASDEALIRAVRAEDIGMVTTLLDAGASPDAQVEGKLMIVTEYANGYQVEEKPDPRGPLALGEAIEHGSLGLIRLLLERGADPDHIYLHGSYRVHLPVRSTRNVKTVINLGGGRQIVDDGRGKVKFIGYELSDDEKAAIVTQLINPLFMAVQRKNLDEEVRLEIVRALVEAGANVNVRNALGQLPADYAADKPALLALLQVKQSVSEAESLPAPGP